MKVEITVSRIRSISFLPLLALLGGCKSVVLDPAGDVAVQERDLLIYSTCLMLLIIVPVMVTTIWYAWSYRASNKKARYEPEWEHSTHLELVIWAAPLFIIICLGALTWVGTHLLDPYRSLGRIALGHAIAKDTKPLEVDVVALNWKWLFIYPEYGVASVNELAAPIDRPIDFHITASDVMNSFYIPALAGQVYAMPAMETRLHGVVNKTGDYEGFSANYSGAGFSGMHFVFHGQTESGFNQWVADIKASGTNLDRNMYQALTKPSENVPISHYASVDAGLYDSILNSYAAPASWRDVDMEKASNQKIPGHSGHAMPTEDHEHMMHHSMSMPDDQ